MSIPYIPYNTDYAIQKLQKVHKDFVSHQFYIRHIV